MIAFLVGLLAAAPATWLLRRFARARGIVAAPNPIVPQHRAPVAYLGGIGIAVGWGAALLAGDATVSSRLPLLLPAAGFLALGLYDDLRPLRPMAKLLLQLVIAALAVTMGARVHVTGWDPLDAAIAGGWIVLLVNAVNVTDVCDGLVAGLALIGFLVLGFVHPAGSAAAWGLAGACAGFLFFNRPTASIYMGDAGSLFLGYALAAMSFPLFDDLTPIHAATITLAAAAAFLFETTLLISVRVRKGLAWWRGSPDHFSLRMQAAGFSKWRTDLVSWTLAAATGGAALLVAHAGAWAPVTLLAGMAVVAVASARWLLRREVG